MKPTLYLMALVLLLGGIVTPCLALMRIDIVSPERAKKLGIEVRAQPGGPEFLWIKLELKPEGELKNFSHVSLEIRDGEKILLAYSPLEAKRSETGTVTVRLMASRTYLDKVTLRVVTTDNPNGGTGHDLRIKDFVNPDKVPAQ